VRASTLFDKIISPIEIKTPRLIITDITRGDSQDYCALYTDDNLNKWWGYDYREDLVGSPTPEYFFEFQAQLKAKKEEYALAVKENGRLIGELVLHHFDYFGGVEIGFRFFKEYQGKGYATESANAVIEYVQSTLKAKIIKSRCFKENVKSRALIERLGLKKVDEDLTHYYFFSKGSVK
jgi:RimJ/RimL family protein N-acetyltransferase